MQNQSKHNITFDTQLKTALFALTIDITRTVGSVVLRIAMPYTLTDAPSKLLGLQLHS